MSIFSKPKHPEHTVTLTPEVIEGEGYEDRLRNQTKQLVDRRANIKDRLGTVFLIGGTSCMLAGVGVGIATGIIDPETARETASRLTGSDAGDALIIGGFASNALGLGLHESAEADRAEAESNNLPNR